MKKLICCVIILAIISSLFLTSYTDINKSSEKSNVTVNVPKIVVFSLLALCPLLKISPPPDKVGCINQVAVFDEDSPGLFIP